MLDDDVRELKTMVMGLGGRLDRIDGRLDRIDGRLDRIDGRIDRIETKLEAHDRRFDALDGRIDGIDGRLDGIDVRLDGIDVRLDGIDGRLADHDRRFDTLQREIRDGLAEKGEYVDLMYGELRAEMQAGFADVSVQFERTRLLITNQFVKAAEHSDGLWKGLRERMDLQVEHQVALFRRQEAKGGPHVD